MTSQSQTFSGDVPFFSSFESDSTFNPFKTKKIDFFGDDEDQSLLYYETLVDQREENQSRECRRPSQEYHPQDHPIFPPGHHEVKKLNSDNLFSPVESGDQALASDSIPSIPLLHASPSNKGQPCIVSKLPHRFEISEKNLHVHRTTSLRSDIACYTPSITRNKEARPGSTSRSTGRASMSPKSKKRVPASMPLSPFSSPQDPGRESRVTEEISKLIIIKKSDERGVFPKISHTKVPIREPRSPKRGHALVQSCSTRVRSQSPQMAKCAIDLSSCTSARSPFGTKKVLQIKPPTTPNGKRLAKCLKTDNEDGIALMFQRSPRNEKDSQDHFYGRDASAVQRRLVGGASRRVRVDEKDPPAQSGRQEKDDASRGSFRARSRSLPKKPVKSNSNERKTFACPERRTYNRFLAETKCSDFPPMSPYRRDSTDPDYPPVSPTRKGSFGDCGAPYALDHQRSFQVDILFPNYSREVSGMDGVAASLPPSQSRRRSCF